MYIAGDFGVRVNREANPELGEDFDTRKAESLSLNLICAPFASPLHCFQSEKVIY